MESIYKFIENYIELKESENRSVTTINNYKQRLYSFANFIKENYGTDNIYDINENTIVAYKNYLIKVKKNCSNSLRTKTVELKQFFDFVVKRIDMNNYKNPMDNISIPGKERIVKNYFEVEGTKAFINTLISHSMDLKSLRNTKLKQTNFVRNASLMVVALITACRVSSLASVRFKDYNPIDEFLVLRQVKGGGEQVKFLQPFVTEIVDKYINDYRPKGLPENAPLWVREKKRSNNPNIPEKETNLYKDSITGKYYTEIGRVEATQICKSYTKVLTGKELSMQELRHSSAMYIYENGGAVADVQQILGHKNATTTENYLHSLRNQREKEVINKMWRNI